MWRWIIAAAIAAGGCKDETANSTSEQAPRAADLAARAGAASDAPAAEPAPKPGPPARSSIPGAATRAWLAGRPRGKRIKAAAVPAPVAAELVELGRPLIGAGDRGARPRLRWARVMSPAALAFSIGYRTEGRDRVMIFSVAVPSNDTLVTRSAQEVRAGEHHELDMGFAADVDADGDGVDDTVVTYSTGWSGGGHSYTGGLIFLGSRAGSTLDVQTEEREAEYEGGEPSERDRVVALQCWTEVGGEPVLLVAGYSDDRYDKEAGRRWDRAAFSADRDGVFAQRAISGAVIAEGELDALVARRKKSGAPGPLRLEGADEFEAPPCSPPPLIIPDGKGRFRLVSDLAIGAPADPGRALLIELPDASP